MRTPSPALAASLVSTFPASGIVGSLFARGGCQSTANWPEPAAGLLRRGLGRLRAGMARVLRAPGADLGAVEDAVVIGVHLVEAGSGPLRCPILCAFGELIPRD